MQQKTVLEVKHQTEDINHNQENTKIISIRPENSNGATKHTTPQKQNIGNQQYYSNKFQTQWS